MPKPQPPKGLKGKTGGVSNKWWLIGGGVGGVLFYMHMRNSSAASAAATPATDPNATTATTDPYANDPYGYDPNAGYGAASYGSGGNVPIDYSAITSAVAAGFPPADPGTTTGSGGDTSGSGGNTSGSSGGHHPVTDKHWMTEAIKALEGKGYTKAEATAAITAYMTGAPMTQQQIHAAETAVGAVGVPPKAPPPIEHAHPKPTGHHGNGGTSHSHGGGSTHSHPGGNKPHGHKPKPKPKKKPVSAWRGGK